MPTHVNLPGCSNGLRPGRPFGAGSRTWAHSPRTGTNDMMGCRTPRVHSYGTDMQNDPSDLIEGGKEVCFNLSSLNISKISL